jgi:hypothetical protein
VQQNDETLECARRTRGNELSRPGRIPLGRLAAEFVVLVIGVLVALGVDRWVAGIDERDQELAYLTELRADFVRNRVLAENGARVEGEVAEFAVVLLESFGREESPEEAARSILAAEVTGWVYYSSYAEGVWSDLQSTGSTLLLRDASLRVEISEFYRSLQWKSELEAELNEDVSSYQLVARQFIDPNVRLALSEDFPGWLGFDATSLLPRLDRFERASVRLPVGAAEALPEPLVSAIIAHHSRSAVYAEDLAQIDSILEMIDRAVGAL